MIMLSTILFIDEQPVGYTVSVEKDKCFFKPTEHTLTNVAAPSFHVIKREKIWEVDGLSDQKIIEQLQATLPVVQDEENTLLSAAP